MRAVRCVRPGWQGLPGGIFRSALVQNGGFQVGSLTRSKLGLHFRKRPLSPVWWRFKHSYVFGLMKLTFYSLVRQICLTVSFQSGLKVLDHEFFQELQVSTTPHAKGTIVWDQAYICEILRK